MMGRMMMRKMMTMMMMGKMRTKVMMMMRMKMDTIVRISSGTTIDRQQSLLHQCMQWLWDGASVFSNQGKEYST